MNRVILIGIVILKLSTHTTKTMSEYDQEIAQSHTADQPTAP